MRTFILLGALGLLPYFTGATASQSRFTNLQVLTGASDQELLSAMTFMSGSLGVTCEHCHVNPWDSDAREAKNTARRMITMVRDLNRDTFGGRQMVTCASCHRGSPRPATVPDMANAGWHPSAVNTAATRLPTVEAVTARYLDAIGASRSLPVARLLQGTSETVNGMRPPQTVTVEILIGSAGELRMLESRPNRPTLTIWNGREGWRKTGSLVAALTAPDVEDVLRTIEAFRVFDAATVADLAPSPTTDRDNGAAVLRGSGPGGHRERIVFSPRTGLIDSRETTLPSPLGSIVERTDYGAYRRVNRWRVPFEIVQSTFSERTRFTFTRIDLAPRIPAGAFSRPE